jgi:Xaa-Pro dipeptidase
LDVERIAETRLRDAQEALRAHSFDALLLATGKNLNFLSGYPYVELTLARPFYFFLPRNGAPTILVHVGRQHEARRLSWIEDIRTYPRLSAAPVAELAAILRDHGLEHGRVGAELGFEQRLGIPFREFERIRDELAPAAFEDAADLLWELRIVKRPWDIEAIRRACTITARAYAETFRSVRAGQAEAEVATRMAQELARGGGSDPWVAITSGTGNYDVVLGPGTARTLEPGDMVWMDSGCAVNGFYSDFGRAGVIGGPTPEQREAQQLIHTITTEGVAMAGPGMPLAEIARHCNRRVSELQLPITSNISQIAGRVGHGVGLDVTEPPHVSEDDATVLKPGMVITIEPGVATEYGIFHVEENVLVTEHCNEVLSNAPRELIALGA